MRAEKPGCGTQSGYSHLAVSGLAWILGRQMFVAEKKDDPEESSGSTGLGEYT